MSSSIRGLSILLILAMASNAMNAYADADFEINKRYFEGGDTLTLSIPSAETLNCEGDISISIFDNETGEIFVSDLAEVKAKPSCYSITLPSSGIRNHDDIIKFFTPLYIDGPCLGVPGKHLSFDTDWESAGNLFGSYVYLKSIPFERITFISLAPLRYKFTFASDPPFARDVDRFVVWTDNRYPANNDFTLKLACTDRAGNKVELEEQINIHKIHFTQRYINGSMLKQANKHLLKRDTRELDYRREY